jgi:HPr kinase/phosphorylase
MTDKYSVSIEKLIQEYKLEIINLPADPSKLFIHSAEVNRPGLLLSAYDDYFDPERIQILGLSETSYLKDLSKASRQKSLERLLSPRPSAIIITRNITVLPELLELSKNYSVPLLRTNDNTSAFIAALIAFLNVELAPRVTRHGVLVEVYGEGLLLIGDSGVGKSETAIELIKRGHRLIADDAVEIRKVSSISLVGSSPENIRHFIELRGIGIINAGRIFGMSAVKMTEKIDMVINLELWNPDKNYSRMGLGSEFTEILGIRVASTTIPVNPGRNLAIIIEVAAMNNRQKKMGYNAATELLNMLGVSEEDMASETPQDVVVDYNLY